MLHKIKKLGKYLITTCLANVVLGLVLYYGFTFLGRFSQLYAYLWNFAVIVIVLVSDELTIKSLESEKLFAKIRREKNPGKVVKSLEHSLNSLGSFKGDLYLFYIFILVFSQIIELAPDFVGESLGHFISANSYSILLLIAFDTLIKQYTEDRERMKRMLAKLKKAIGDGQDGIAGQDRKD